MQRRFQALLILALVIGACTQETVSPEIPEVPVMEEAVESAFITGSLIIQSENNAEELQASLSPILGEVTVSRLFPDAGEWEPRHRAAGLDRWFRIKYNPEDLPQTKAVADLSSLPGVVYVEPERRINTTGYFNDPDFDKLWALNNPGGSSSYVSGIDLNVIPVWQNYTTGSSDVIVAVVDMGVDLSHPDLSPVVLPAGEKGSKSFVYDNPGYNIVPGDHGTHVAGIIGAVNNNEIGISSVAGGENGQGGVRILSCAMMQDNPSDPKKPLQGDAYNAIVWAADHGAVICNNSWDNVYESEAEALNGKVGSVGPAIDYFVKYAGCDADGNQLPDSPMKGGLVLFAAGNDSWRMAWPAAYEKVVAVGAVSANGDRASYSNYGDWVDICAPGGSSGAKIYSTVKGGGYDYKSGTSMACPEAAGVAALIVSHFGGPGFTADMLKERLLKGASKDKAPKFGQIGPLVDALGSFTYGGTTPPDPVNDFTLSSSANIITASWAVTADPDDEKAFGYLVMASKQASDFTDLNVKSLPSSMITFIQETGTVAVGETLSATLSSLEFETPYYVAIVAYDYQQNYSAVSAVKTISTKKNNPPVITTDYSGDWRVLPFETLRAQFTITDPDDHPFTVEWTPGSKALSFNETFSGYQLTIAGNGAPSGNYTAHIVAKDSFGASTDFVINYTLAPNHAPVILASIENMLFTEKGARVTLDMSKYVSDPDGETLKYTGHTSTQNIVHLSPEGKDLIITSLGYGSADVQIVATDAMGESVSLSFKVLVRDPGVTVSSYPNPVTTTLYITCAEVSSVNINVKIMASSGGCVYEDTVSASAFDPATIDVSGLAPGVYTLMVTYSDKTYKQTIVKK